MSTPTFHGRFVERGMPDYERARTEAIFNARKPGRFPSAVLEAETVDDVVAGVRLARDRGWGVTVRAGGHSWVAWSLHDDVLLIDISGLHEMELREPGVAVVSPGVRGGEEFSPFLRERGWIFTGGHCPPVGLGGFVLQGGQGWNGRPWGWACENLLALDVVLPDGSLVHASADSHPDLYWAARGSGPGFFAVAVRFYLHVRPLPTHFVQTAFAIPVAYFDDVLAWAHDVLPTLDIRVEPVIAGARTAPPGIDHDGTPLLTMAATGMFDTLDEAERLMAPLADCPHLDKALMTEFAQPATWDQVNEMQRAMNPEEHRYAVDCAWTDATAAELGPLLRPLFTGLPTEESFCIWYGWNPTRPLADMAFSMEANVYLAVYAIWKDAAYDDRVQGWVTERFRALEPVTKGVYLGDADLLRRPGKFMADANFARLEAIRDRYDPNRMFPGFRVKPGTTVNEFEPR